MRVRGLLLVLALLPGACLSRPPAAARAGTSGGECRLDASDATVWLHGAEREGGAVEKVEVGPVFLRHKPSPGSEALVVPYPAGEPVRLKVLNAERQEDGASWLVRLEDARSTSLRELRKSSGDRRPEAPSNAVVLWPAPKGPVRVVSPEPSDLPAEVKPAIVKAALDLDGDGHGDLLLVEFCCGQRATREACEYFCGETWQKIGKRWVRCSSWQPA